MLIIGLQATDTDCCYRNIKKVNVQYLVLAGNNVLTGNKVEVCYIHLNFKK